MSKLHRLLFAAIIIAELPGLVAASPKISSRAKLTGLAETRDGRAKLAPQPNQYLIRSTDADRTLAALRAGGGSGRKITDSLLFARSGFSLIERIAESPAVKLIDAPSRLYPFLDLSIPEIRADLVHAGSGLAAPYTGKGVITAIIDNGVSYTHPDFKFPDGSTRILWLWDQAYEDGDPPEGYDYGGLCSAVDINNGWCNLGVEESIDGYPTFGHGTHIAGIAAGGNETYTGVAPDSLLIVVRARFLIPNVLEAVKFVVDKADELGMPVSINMSIGSQEGGHDGTTLFEETLADFTGPGKIISAAAGNHGPGESGSFFYHLSHAVDRQSRSEFKPNFYISGENTILFEAWQPAGGDIRFAIAAADGATIVDQTDFLDHDQTSSTTLYDGDKVVGIVDMGDAIYPENGYRHTVVEIRSPSEKMINIGSKRWHLITEGSSGAVFHAWTTNENGYWDDEEITREFTYGGATEQYLFHPGDADYSITMPASHPEIIGVGSSVIRKQWDDLDGVRRSGGVTPELGEVSVFSSRGPTLDGRVKPDILAPGELIASTTSEDYSPPRSYMIDESHHLGRGTSQATPLVAGAAACMLEKNRNLTPAEAVEIIKRNAKIDAQVGDAPNNDYGYGKFDLYQIFSDPLFVEDETEDIRPPVIEDISFVGGDEPIVSWSTDEPADGYVEYAPADQPEMSRRYGRMTPFIAHRLVIPDLVEGVRYEFQICSTDIAGNASCEEIDSFTYPCRECDPDKCPELCDECSGCGGGLCGCSTTEGKSNPGSGAELLLILLFLAGVRVLPKLIRRGNE